MQMISKIEYTASGPLAQPFTTKCSLKSAGWFASGCCFLPHKIAQSIRPGLSYDFELHDAGTA
jgi:hypothetical protein